MIDYNMIYVYVLLTLFSLMDAGLTMLANPTMQAFEGNRQLFIFFGWSIFNFEIVFVM
jgi:hypothetical protein